ncbi:anchored repeat-type ABC transporter permease subunit [Streptomyces sp. RFCAC02]|uniref:anchored repeat-type ABC transporter permease subunit n=1 Tax=Streptomyces sp. RFCAC02 TaxID=2499143 RepID=UPI001F1170DD|nr:anchored repeat-type ABC transporter permease subunit [Streptomyces sp. RFCAC02]
MLSLPQFFADLFNPALSFLPKALFVALMSSAVCGVIGCYVVLRGMAFIGDAVSHAVFPGLAAAFVLQGNLVLGGSVAGVLTAVAVAVFAQNRRLREDSVIGVFFVAAFALGIVIISRSPGYAGSLEQFLFGSITGIPDEDIYVVAVSSVVLLSITFLLHKEFVAVTLDRESARALGLPVFVLDLVLYVMVSMAVVVSVGMIGNILVLALLVTPAATARLLTDRIGVMMCLAPLIGGFSAFTGLYLSWSVDLPTGGTIVLVATCVFLLAWLLAPGTASAPACSCGCVLRAPPATRCRRRPAAERAARRSEGVPACGRGPPLPSAGPGGAPWAQSGPPARRHRPRAARAAAPASVSRAAAPAGTSRPEPVLASDPPPAGSPPVPPLSPPEAVCPADVPPAGDGDAVSSGAPGSDGSVGPPASPGVPESAGSSGAPGVSGPPGSPDPAASAQVSVSVVASCSNIAPDERKNGYASSLLTAESAGSSGPSTTSVRRWSSETSVPSGRTALHRMATQYLPGAVAAHSWVVVSAPGIREWLPIPSAVSNTTPCR